MALNALLFPTLVKKPPYKEYQADIVETKLGPEELA
jgi:hypothetical protein